jgi:DNA invertase Pin-like site-specific DNA recombinase
MIFGYVRVSTDDQRLDARTDALTAAGAERICQSARKIDPHWYRPTVVRPRHSLA